MSGKNKSTTTGREDLIYQWFWDYAAKCGIKLTDPPGVKRNFGTFSTKNLERVFGLVDPSENPRKIRNVALYGFELGKPGEPCGLYFCVTASELTGKEELQNRLDKIKEHTGITKEFINKKSGRVKPNIYIGLKTNSKTFAPNAFTKEDITRETIERLVDYIIEQDEQRFCKESCNPDTIPRKSSTQHKRSPVEKTESQDNSLHARAKRGDANAQYELGVMFFNGEDVDEDSELGEFLLTEAAKQGHVEAQYILGVRYYNGDGLEEDDDKAFFWTKKAAMLGQHKEAQKLLGDMYRSGHGTSEDMKQTVYWYKMAAGQGELESQYNLGSMYWDGIGVEENKEDAAYWWEKAAEQGDAEAQYKLGYIYMAGEGAKKDSEKALSLVKSAAAQGYKEAIDLLKGLEDGRKENNAPAAKDENRSNSEDQLSILGVSNLYLKTTWGKDSQWPYLTLCSRPWVFVGNNKEAILNLFLDNLYENIGDNPPPDTNEFYGKEAVLPYKITHGENGAVIETWAENISMMDRHLLATSLIIYLKAKNANVELIEIINDYEFDDDEDSDEDEERG